MIHIDNYTVDEFIRQMEWKKIVCFGAGQKFLDLCNKYRLKEKILYVVDNYLSKTTVEMEGKKIPVLTMKEMGEEIKECILLLTSVKYAKEFIVQLETIPLCKDLTFYVPDLFVEDIDTIEVEKNETNRIPKCIHYCWFGRGKMPERFQKNIETWKKYCPDYEIVKWDETNYDISKNRYMKEAYETKKWGFVPDYARLDIINSNGGIYFDTDVELLRPLDPLLSYELFCGFETSKYVAFGLGFGAVKENPILQEMLDQYEHEKFIMDNGELNLVASPVYQTRVLERHGLVKNGKTQINKDFLALSAEYLSPISPYGVGNPTARSFSIHQYAASWFDDKQQKEKNRLICNYKYIMNRMKQDSLSQEA